MKNFVLLLTFLLAGVFEETYAQGIRFHEGTFEEALAQAKKENKLVFVDFYTTWCGPCKWMSTSVFTRSDIGDYFNKNFISCKIDAEKEGKGLAVKYEIRNYPTMLFLNAEGEIVSKVIGRQEALQLIALARVATSGDKSYNYSNLTKSYEQKKHDPEFLKHYMEQMTKTGKRVYDALENYLKVQTDMEEASVEMMEFLMKYKKDMLLGGKVEEVFINNYDEFWDIATRHEEKDLKDMRYQIFANTRGVASSTKNIELFKYAMQFIPKVPAEYLVSYNDMRLDLLKLEGKEKEYRREAVLYVDSIVSSRSIEEVNRTDREFHTRKCHEIDSTGEGGIYRNLYKEAYRDLGAIIQIGAIIKEGSRLLDGAKKKDYKNIWRWIDYGKRLLPTDFKIRNFEATVLYRQGKKDEAIELKKQIMHSKDLKDGRLQFVIGEELKKIEEGTF